MKVCLTTKLEVSMENEVSELLENHFPNCKINIVVKPRKYKKKKAKKKVNKTVKIVKKDKIKTATKPISYEKYMEQERLQDYYNKAIQEDGIKQIVEYYTKIKELER